MWGLASESPQNNKSCHLQKMSPRNWVSGNAHSRKLPGTRLLGTLGRVVVRLLLYPSSSCLTITRRDKSDREDHCMAEQERPQKRGSGFFRLFERGVDTATRNNVTAYGYSVSITAAFAILQTSRSDTGILEIFVFAAGAVVAFAIVGALASGFFRETLEDQPSNVKALAGALSFLSVGLALGVAYVVGILIQSLAGWPVTAFLTTIVYVASVGLELAVAHRMLGSDE